MLHKNENIYLKKDSGKSKYIIYSTVNYFHITYWSKPFVNIIFEFFAASDLLVIRLVVLNHTLLVVSILLSVFLFLCCLIINSRHITSLIIIPFSFILICPYHSALTTPVNSGSSYSY